MSAENLWRVEIVNAASDESDENGKKAVWHSINSQVNEVIDYFLQDKSLSHWYYVKQTNDNISKQF